jgi:chromosome segregation ATPase
MSNHLEAENERLQREIESHQTVGQAAALVMQAYLNQIAALESKLAESQKREEREAETEKDAKEAQLRLSQMVESMRQERDKWKQDHRELSESARELQQENDRLREEIETLKSFQLNYEHATKLDREDSSEERERLVKALAEAERQLEDAERRLP